MEKLLLMITFEVRALLSSPSVATAVFMRKQLITYFFHVLLLNTYDNSL